MQEDGPEGFTSYSQDHILKEAHDLSEDIAASIPFHLARNVDEFLINKQQIDPMKQEAVLPNRSIGGVSLMYPIHVVSALSVVPLHLREMFREHLAWIGRVMGIGQARLLADVSILPFRVNVCRVNQSDR